MKSIWRMFLTRKEPILPEAGRFAHLPDIVLITHYPFLPLHEDCYKCQEGCR